MLMRPCQGTQPWCKRRPALSASLVRHFPAFLRLIRYSAVPANPSSTQRGGPTVLTEALRCYPLRATAMARPLQPCGQKTRRWVLNCRNGEGAFAVRVQTLLLYILLLCFFAVVPIASAQPA